MPASNSLKASDKQKIVKKLVTELKKHYKGTLPKQPSTVLETLLFAACLEDSDYETAEQAFTNLYDSFFDLNEVRVSSVTEVEEALGDVEYAGWKALRIREVLQYTFEEYYAFDLETLKRKTQDAANKELDQINHVTPFMKDYTIQHALGAHVLPVDKSMANVLRWLNLTDEDADPSTAADDIKAGIKKAEGPSVCYLLKCVSVEPALQPAFEDGLGKEDDEDPFDAPKRLVELIKNPIKKKAAKRPKKSTKKKTTSKTVSKKKPAAKKASSTTKRKASTSSKKTVKKKKPEKKKSTKKKSKK